MNTIKINNILASDNYRFSLTCDQVFNNFITEDFDGSSLTAFPAIIDPHVHFRVPGHEKKESWKAAALPAISGGVTTVFDMPNNIPFTSSVSRLISKNILVKEQLKEIGIPLRYKLFLGATSDNIAEIEMLPMYRHVCCGIKVFVGGSTDANFLSREVLENVFRSAAELDLVVAVHAEDEDIIRQAHERMHGNWHLPNAHSLSRPAEAACKAVELVIDLSHKHGTKVHILHVSLQQELELIRQGKKTHKNIFAEAAIPHLFFDEQDYMRLGKLIKVNPPIRQLQDKEALWEAVNSGLIDTVGSDHAPHLMSEKQRAIGESPSGIPGNPFLLPLLLNAVNTGLLTKEKLVQVTHENIVNLYNLEKNNDLVLVDMEREHTISEKDITSLCGWSPFLGKRITGWPKYTLCKEILYPGISLYL